MLRYLAIVVTLLLATPALAQTPVPVASATPTTHAAPPHAITPPKAAVPAPSAEQKASALKLAESDHVLGKADAPVTVIEYASLSCPHCAAAHQTSVAQLITKYVDTGKVKYVFRDFALNAPALRAGMLAQCAGKDKYFTFVKVLFEQQSQWAFHKDYQNMLEKIAKLGGVSAEQFKSCMNDKALEDRLIATKKQAIEGLAIQSTPTFFINGTPLEGHRTIEEFAAIIDPLLKK